MAQRVSLEYKPVPLFLSIFNRSGVNNRRYLAKMCAFTYKVHERNCALTWGRQTVMYARDHSIYSSSKFIVHSIAAIIYVCMYTYKSCTPAAGIRRPQHQMPIKFPDIDCAQEMYRKCQLFLYISFIHPAYSTCHMTRHISFYAENVTFPVVFLHRFCTQCIPYMQVHFLRAGNITCFA